ncbi:MAG: ankyrin repeat domain-containing protein [Terriglobia bacterium]
MKSLLKVALALLGTGVALIATGILLIARQMGATPYPSALGGPAWLSLLLGSLLLWAGCIGVAVLLPRRWVILAGVLTVASGVVLPWFFLAIWLSSWADYLEIAALAVLVAGCLQLGVAAIRGKGRRPRWVAVGALGGLLVVLLIANVFVYRDRFYPVYFDWQAETGFRMISTVPAGRHLGFFGEVYGGLVTLQARSWIAHEFRTGGWTKAKGHLFVQLLPALPPVVIGLAYNAEPWEIIDPDATPLMQAAERGDLQAVKTLLASGADVNARDQRGWTPLMHASMSLKANAEVVRTLIAAGADVNAKDRVGRTALIWAAGLASDGRGKVGVLLAAHADPNAKSTFGETPLECVVGDAGALDVAAQLLAAGADPNAKAREGGTVLSLAAGAGDTEMVQLLKRFGARE